MIFKNKFLAFTLIELLVVIVIIGILSGIGMSLYSNSMKKARDTVRVSDMQMINKALLLRQTEKGCVPKTVSYGENDKKGWDRSTQRGFMTFLETEKYLEKVPVDPINNLSSISGEGEYEYMYYCYPNSGVSLRYKSEVSEVPTYAVRKDSNFICCKQ